MADTLPWTYTSRDFRQVRRAALHSAFASSRRFGVDISVPSQPLECQSQGHNLESRYENDRKGFEEEHCCVNDSSWILGLVSYRERPRCFGVCGFIRTLACLNKGQTWNTRDKTCRHALSTHDGSIPIIFLLLHPRQPNHTSQREPRQG